VWLEMMVVDAWRASVPSRVVGYIVLTFASCGAAADAAAFGALLMFLPRLLMLLLMASLA